MSAPLRALVVVLLTAAISGCGQVYAGLPEDLTLDQSLAEQADDAQLAIDAWNQAFPGCPHTLHVGVANADTFGGVYLAENGQWEDPATRATYDPNTGSIAIGRTPVPSFWVPRLLIHELGHGHQAEHASPTLSPSFSCHINGLVQLVTEVTDFPYLLRERIISGPRSRRNFARRKVDRKVCHLCHPGSLLTALLK